MVMLMLGLALVLVLFEGPCRDGGEGADLECDRLSKGIDRGYPLEREAWPRNSDGQGRNGFVAFEIKFSESMREPMPELKPRHAELSDASGLFTDPAATALRANPLQQFWREHLLAQSMIDNGLYDEGYLVTIAPGLNYHVQEGRRAPSLKV
jgi:hypothetical protein